MTQNNNKQPIDAQEFTDFTRSLKGRKLINEHGGVLVLFQASSNNSDTPPVHVGGFIEGSQQGVVAAIVQAMIQSENIADVFKAAVKTFKAHQRGEAVNIHVDLKTGEPLGIEEEDLPSILRKAGQDMSPEGKMVAERLAKIFESRH